MGFVSSSFIQRAWGASIDTEIPCRFGGLVCLGLLLLLHVLRAEAYTVGVFRNIPEHLCNATYVWPGQMKEISLQSKGQDHQV